MTKNMIISVDVDHIPGSHSGVEKIMDLLHEKGVLAAFFITGKFAEECPDVVGKIARRGHEIGCHGHSHGLDVHENFIDMGYEEQVERIVKSTGILRDIIGRDVTMFRAPYAKANGDTIRALEDQGYSVDSSVTSRRFDFGMGVSNSIGAFFAPTRPYHPSRRNIYKRGDSSVLEIPISAFFVPLTMSAIRKLGLGTVKRLFHMSLRSFDPVVFYVHPWEVMGIDEVELWEGAPKRHLKKRGDAALEALDFFVEYVRERVDFTLFRDVADDTVGVKTN